MRTSQKAHARVFPLLPRVLSYAKEGKKERPMATKQTKAELTAKLAEMGIAAPAKATLADLKALLKDAETAKNAENAPGTAEKTVKCSGFDALNVRLGPSKSAPVVGELKDGEKVAAELLGNGWARLEAGYCMAKYLV